MPRQALSLRAGMKQTVPRIFDGLARMSYPITSGWGVPQRLPWGRGSSLVASIRIAGKKAVRRKSARPSMQGFNQKPDYSTSW
jgi:hypothetical protein